MTLVPALRVGVVQAVNGAEVATTAGSVVSVVAQGSVAVGTSPAFLPGGPAPSTPAVPATTVNATNSNAFPVTVVITGGTLTAVVVNGVTVGTTAGTYTVPAGGTISITYSVAPTWAWSNNFALPAPVNTSTTYTVNQSVPVAAVSNS